MRIDIYDRRSWPVLPRQGEVAPEASEGEDTEHW